MIDKDKYFVAKRDDLLDAIHDNPAFRAIMATRLNDAHVIREQDVFAASAFYAYAHHIRGVVDVLDQQRALNGDLRDHLNEIADYFMDAADKAEANQKKLPD